MSGRLFIHADVEVRHGADIITLSGEGDQVRVSFPGIRSALRIFRSLGWRRTRGVARLAHALAGRMHVAVLVTVRARPVWTVGPSSRSPGRRLLGL